MVVGAGQSWVSPPGMSGKEQRPELEALAALAGGTWRWVCAQVQGAPQRRDACVVQVAVTRRAFAPPPASGPQCLTL